MWWGIKDLIGGKPKTGKLLTIWSPHLCASTKWTITAVIFDVIDTLPLTRFVKLYLISLQNTHDSTAQIQDWCSLSFIAVELGGNRNSREGWLTGNFTLQSSSPSKFHTRAASVPRRYEMQGKRNTGKYFPFGLLVTWKWHIASKTT